MAKPQGAEGGSSVLDTPPGELLLLIYPHKREVQ